MSWSRCGLLSRTPEAQGTSGYWPPPARRAATPSSRPTRHGGRTRWRWRAGRSSSGAWASETSLAGSTRWWAAGLSSRWSRRATCACSPSTWSTSKTWRTRPWKRPSARTRAPTRRMWSWSAPSRTGRTGASTSARSSRACSRRTWRPKQTRRSASVPRATPSSRGQARATRARAPASSAANRTGSRRQSRARLCSTWRSSPHAAPPPPCRRSTAGRRRCCYSPRSLSLSTTRHLAAASCTPARARPPWPARAGTRARWAPLCPPSTM
mmetsp:Transcript_7364/g.19315  ORF Transcript_7364/g.19315 Transcript_7364/m.19315 type:complete len:268 (+) Transcript_7364:908-1711(+)